MLYRVLLAAALLISAGFLAPQSVLGSCGDWLAHPSMTALTSDHPIDSIAHSDTKAPLPIPKRPCNGPRCQQSPMTPIPAPSAPQTEFRRVDLAIWCDVPVIASCSYELSCKEDFLDLARGYVLGIYRPPTPGVITPAETL